MNKKYLVILPVLLFLIFCSAKDSLTQTSETRNKTPEEMATKKADRMREYLSLTDAQYSSIYNLMLQKIKDRENNKEKFHNTDKETRKQLRRQYKDEFKKQLESILNQDQLLKFQEMKGKHSHKKGNKGKDKRKIKE